MKEFKIGDKVFYKIDPEWTTTNEAALESTISSVIHELDKYDGLSVKEYRINFGTFDEDKYVKPEVIFETREEAIESVKKDLDKKIKDLEKRLENYKIIFNGLS